LVINTEIPVDSREETHYCLAKNAPAMQIIPDGSGKLRLGALVRLPEGAEVEVCGEGFDNRTAKVLWEGATYYVFLDDLQKSRRLSAVAAL
jgi:hypothetical protein